MFFESASCVPHWRATFGTHQGRVSIVCGTKPAFEKPVESVSLEVRLPERVVSADPSATHGMATYDDIGHHVKWVIDKFPSDKTPCLTVQLQLESNLPKKGSAEADAIAASGGKAMVSLQELVDIHAQFSVAGRDGWLAIMFHSLGRIKLSSTRHAHVFRRRVRSKVT